MVKTNNYYYKVICEKVTGETETGTHNDLYYLEKIAHEYGDTSTHTKCKGYYLRRFCLGVCVGMSITGSRSNVWYLKKIAEFLTSATHPWVTENYYLNLISIYIDNPIPPVSPFDGVALEVANPILSYSDGDSTSLTAQLTYQGEEVHLSGKSVSFDIVDGNGDVVTHIGDGTTDSNGVATSDNDYDSQGIGDLTIQASVVNGSDTYTDTEDVEDCTYYNPNVISSATTVNISLPSAPFEVKYSVSVASNGGGTGFLRFNDASGFYTGKGASSSRNIYLNSQVLEQIPSLQTYYEYTMTYQNGVATLSRSGNSVSESVASLTSLYLINSNYNTYVKGIKIKPL